MTELLLAVVGLLLGFIVKDYLAGYARKKGENLATNEGLLRMKKT